LTAHLSLDSTKRHDLSLVVETIGVVAVIGNGSEGDNIVEIEPSVV
jgi:hypothetical protein